MRVEFRIVQFVANPFSGLCFPVAALVRDADGDVRVVVPTSTLDAHRLGSQKAANALLSMAKDLAELRSFDRLPRHFGPHFTLSAPQPAPSERPHQWVLETVFAATPRASGVRSPS